jgi:hypothetical protein
MDHTGPHDSVCQCLHSWFTMSLKIIYSIHHILQLLKFSTCCATTLQHPCMPAGTVDGRNSDWVGKSRENSAFNSQVDSSSKWWIQQTLHILITHLLPVPNPLSASIILIERTTVVIHVLFCKCKNYVTPSICSSDQLPTSIEMETCAMLINRYQGYTYI